MKNAQPVLKGQAFLHVQMHPTPTKAEARLRKHRKAREKTVNRKAACRRPIRSRHVSQCQKRGRKMKKQEGG